MTLDEANRSKEEQQIRQRLTSLRSEKISVENEAQSLSTAYAEKVRLESKQRTDLEDKQARLQKAQAESRSIKNREQTATRNVEKSKMLIQSTKRMIEGNQGVSNNGKTLLKDPNVMGLLLSCLLYTSPSPRD